MRKPIAYLPSIGKDMDNLQAESLIYEVRCYRYRGFEPTMYLSKSDFERLADFWSRFYTTSRAKVPQDGKLVVWLKRLFRVKVREKLIFYQISDDALVKFGARILERKAIPIDGLWTDIAIVQEAGKEMTDKEARKDIETGHGFNGWLVENLLATYGRYRARELSPLDALEQTILCYLASHGAANREKKAGRTKVSKLPAGRKLDALIAEKVLGWFRVISPSGIECMMPPPDGSIERELAWLPYYTTDIAAAWKIIAQMKARFSLDTSLTTGKFWCAKFEDREDGTWQDEVEVCAMASTAPLAICHAALKFVEAREAREAK